MHLSVVLIAGYVIAAMFGAASARIFGTRHGKQVARGQIQTFSARRLFCTTEVPTIVRINGKLFWRPDGLLEADIAAGDTLYLNVDGDGGNHYKVVEVRRSNPERGFNETDLDHSIRIVEVYFFQDGCVDQVCRTWTIMKPLEDSMMAR